MKQIEQRAVNKMKRFLDNMSAGFCEGVNKFDESGIEYIRNKFNENYPNNEIPAERLEDIQMYPYILKNWDKDYSKGLPIIKPYLNTNFEDTVVDAKHTRDNKLLKTEKLRSIYEFEPQNIISFARFFGKNGMITKENGDRLSQVRNAIAHYTIRKNISENLFKFCMESLLNVVDEMRLKLPFDKKRQELLSADGDSLNKTVNKICFLMLGSNYSMDDEHLLETMKSNYDILDYYKTKVTTNKNIGQCREVYKMAIDNLKSHKNAENELKESFNNHLKGVWNMKLGFIGKLRDCIEKILKFKKDEYLDKVKNISNRKLIQIDEVYPAYEDCMKIAILAIERYSKKQLLGNELEITFSEFEKNCENKMKNRNKNTPQSSTGKKNKKRRMQSLQLYLIRVKRK